MIFPTKFGIFKNKKSKEFLKNSNYPIIIKADNLASGKGVYICNNYDESIIAVEEIFNGKFGKAENLLIEEYLEGEDELLPSMMVKFLKILEQRKITREF